MTFEIGKGEFLKDGKPIKIISGAVHYFRNPKGYWDDVLQKLVALGCNCVETYCAWNLHEPEPDKFNFEGDLDLAHFIRLAGEKGLMVIVRPGPYICAEWEFGGLPWWLQTIDGMEIRCMNKAYLDRFDRYLDNALGLVKPYLATNGGPVIMMQVENEYGYYGDDKNYLDYLYNGYRQRGIDVPLFTSDGSAEWNVINGTQKDCLCTLNFGSMNKWRFEVQQRLCPDQPMMCAEMWNGWFDHWGAEKHATTDAEAYAKELDSMLSVGSANMYMFIGGTNFGFMNGANHKETYEPTVTSYDYDALLTENGSITQKYMLCREVIQKYTGATPAELPADRPCAAYGQVKISEYASLLDNLQNLDPNPIQLEVPKPMEDCGLGYGYIAYTTCFKVPVNNKTLEIADIGDRAYVFAGNKLVKIMYVNDGDFSCEISLAVGEPLTIVVENMGRTNFGSKMMRKKGIIGRVTIDSVIHFGWTAYRLDMKDLSRLSFSCDTSSECGFGRCFFEADGEHDTFLECKGFGKGFAVVNGFNLGRYWEIGPTKTLYIPKFLLKKGQNELIVFDAERMGCEGQLLDLTDHANLG